jgi:SAM-dependent methyltransferase
MKEEDIRKREIHNRYLELVEKDVKKMFPDQKQFLEINCPACASRDFKPQFDKLGFTYVLCQGCGTLFVNPRPSLKALNEFYTKSDSATFWVEKFFKPVAEARREKIFQPRAEFIKDRFSKNIPQVIGDVGAGFGIFLEELGKFWSSAKMIAIEPSLDMIEICKQKGLEVIPSVLEDVAGWDERFDILVSFELFEHLYNPGKFLEKIWNLLRPGGYFFLTTLNGEGFDIQILWEKSKSIAPPQHLNFFNLDSISLLLKSQGFVVENISTPGKLDWDIVEGSYKAEGGGIGIPRFWELIAQKADQKTKDELQDWIAENGFSSHMRILAKKEK